MLAHSRRPACAPILISQDEPVKLDHDFNLIRVRRFILRGAPIFSRRTLLYILIDLGSDEISVIRQVLGHGFDAGQFAAINGLA